MQPIVLYCFFLIHIYLWAVPCNCADPDPLQDFCIADLEAPVSVNGFPCKPASKVTSEDFFFEGLSKEGDTRNAFGSNITAGNVLNFPGVNTMGITMSRVDFAHGGINPPHSHPRATESGVVIEGKLLVGMLSTENVYYSKVLGPGHMFVVPRGLVHFQMNVGEGKALAYTVFNSQLPGSVVASVSLFGSKPSVPDEVLTKSFLVEKQVIDEIKSKFTA